MRMWMISPRMLCDQHLVAEHGELHKLVGTIDSHPAGRQIARTLCQKGHLDLTSVQARHHKLAREMRRRGMEHDSPIFYMHSFSFSGGVDPSRSKRDLRNRCGACKQRINNRTP